MSLFEGDGEMNFSCGGDGMSSKGSIGEGTVSSKENCNNGRKQ